MSRIERASKPAAADSRSGASFWRALAVAGCLCLFIIAATSGVAADPTVRNAQTADGLPGTVEVTFDSALDLADADEDDLAAAFEFDADTETDAAIESARIGDPQSTVVLELTAPIVPQDGDLEGALSFTNDGDVLIADADGDPASAFEDKTIENNLLSPTPEAATLADGAPETITIEFDKPVDLVDADGTPVGGDDSGLEHAFAIDNTAADVSLNSVAVADDTVTLSLSAPVAPAADPTVEFSQFGDADFEARLQAANGVAVDDFTIDVDNDLTGPAPETAMVSAERPETVTVQFSEPIAFDGDADALSDAFELAGDNETTLATAPTIEGVADADADDAVVLSLSAPLSPTDDPVVSFAPRDSTEPPSMLQSAADGVPAEGIEDLTVDNGLAGPALQTAVVPDDGPATARLAFDEPVELVDTDGTSSAAAADDIDLHQAFAFDGDTEANITIEAVDIDSDGEAVALSLSAAIDATDGEDGIIEDAVSFEQAAVGATLRGEATGVAVGDLDEIGLRNDVAIEDPTVPPTDPDPLPDPNPGPDPDTDSGGSSGTGGGVLADPPASVAHGVARSVTDAEPSEPGTTFRIGPTNLVELQAPTVTDAAGILAVDEFRAPPPEAPSLGDRPFVTAFQIDPPDGVDEAAATLRIRVPHERLVEVRESTGQEIAPQDLTVLRVADDEFNTVETTVVDETDDAVFVEAETDGFSRFIVTAAPDAAADGTSVTAPAEDPAATTGSGASESVSDVGSEPGTERTDILIGGLVASGLVAVFGLVVYRRRRQDDEGLERL